jgi:hypothetical protein
MNRICTLVGLLLLIGTQTLSISHAAEDQKPEAGKGTTVEDLARGLRSAGQNVEKEIPKIGSAIGETFKKITGKSSDNKPSPDTSKDKK